VAVMYAGEIVEEGSVADVFDDPHHPYTKGLLGAMPQYSDDRAQLAVIAGQVPPLQAMPSGCRFHPRCPYALPVCRSEPVQLRGDADRKSRCIRATELSAESSTNVVLRHR
jgi:oligopeptide/dipeptide ABC transporter ATP-binding protein